MAPVLGSGSMPACRALVANFIAAAFKIYNSRSKKGGGISAATSTRIVLESVIWSLESQADGKCNRITYVELLPLVRCNQRGRIIAPANRYGK